ncbi:MAM and LDL-receptor class A domain-containing protein 1-like [Schistocerca cancellata]|uniref:MAM and LDL-receptor class A domain-containing protein 1-like n=1 Tax=Schistocerca cancellata TaxID=274614 RepID=UPI00211878FB|nr:MAM and LDL-receptor class A domain-containing protein 1-like [Schistocerca cancellata]XP_049780982.1 MAM and LDL-receptor class A domain-containing protein 1-like [Schistocerca cancellata]
MTTLWRLALVTVLLLNTAAGDIDYEDIVERFKRQPEPSEICDFGMDNDLLFCDWANRNGSATQWFTGAGTLSNWLGGPPTDASTASEKGGYVFFETSALGLMADMRGQSAFLESPIMGSTGADGKCVSFSFIIDGLSAAGLRVLLHPVSEDGSPDGFDRILWSTKDPTGNNTWQEAEVLFTYSKEQRVVFEALAREPTDTYRHFRGYVALDNVALKPGTECRGHCSFEAGFCGWTNDEEDDFDWTLGRGSHNPATGPASDRTSFVHGGLEGGYTFIDSSYPRRPGDVARLTSMELQETGPDSPKCLRFWTHMYGNGIGTLSVILSDAREGQEKLLWSLSGEAGNAWYQAEVPISSLNPYKIIFAGKVGRNSLGDIALDDVSLTPGSCPTTPQIAAAIPGDCTFEIDECGWSNTGARDNTDDIDWERVSGQATRTNTQDHTLGTEKGFLMTLARNNVLRPGSRAWFLSPEYKGSENAQCLSFWYVLNEPFIDNTGPSLGALTVYTRSMDKSGTTTLPIWRLYNHQGPEWHYAQARILQPNNYNIIIEGTWGSSRANGFIGFDDITLFDGACSTTPVRATVRKGECRFDRDTCDWMNDTTERGTTTWRLATVARRPANLPDKTFGAPGGYVYFDLFNQNAAASTVRLISPVIEATDDRQLCFSFWFAAFGQGDMAELRVVRQDNNTSGDYPPEKLWTLSAGALDTTRAVWTPAQVTVEAASDFRIVLEGQATNGGFAVDELTFSDGSCSTRPDIADTKLQDNENL